MNNQKFIYLIQGESRLISNFSALMSRKDIDVIYQTYDKPVENAIYFQGSTWGEGRNALLEKALESQKKYEYYIFLDDDVRFVTGDFERFEKQLIKYEPTVAVPVFEKKTRNCVLGLHLSFFKPSKIIFEEYQVCKLADGQFLAFHKDVVFDRLVMPLQTKFDSVSWWCTSSVQQLLILNLYRNSFLQFNNVVVANDEHRKYVKKPFDTIQHAWFEKQFIHPIKDPRPYALNLLSPAMLRVFVEKRSVAFFFKCIGEFISTVILTAIYRKPRSSRISEKQILRLLKRDSDLFMQFSGIKDQCPVTN